MQPNYEHKDFQTSFREVSNLLVMAVMAVSVFWTVLIKRLGSIGTRAYAMPFVFSLLLTMVLAAGVHFNEADALLMSMAVMFLVAGYVFQIACTLRQRAKGEHVHSYNIGNSRLGKYGIFLEGVAGIGAGLGFINLGCPVFGGYLAASAFCTVLTAGIVIDRDRLRRIAIKDAELEQTVLSENCDG